MPTKQAREANTRAPTNGRLQTLLSGLKGIAKLLREARTVVKELAVTIVLVSTLVSHLMAAAPWSSDYTKQAVARDA